MTETAICHQQSPARGLLPLPYVQFWETENSWRLDSSHRGGHRRDIPCLVDAADVRTLNALRRRPFPLKRHVSRMTKRLGMNYRRRRCLPRSGKVWLMPTRWGILDDALKANAGGKLCFT